MGDQTLFNTFASQHLHSFLRGKQGIGIPPKKNSSSILGDPSNPSVPMTFYRMNFLQKMNAKANAEKYQQQSTLLPHSYFTNECGNKEPIPTGEQKIEKVISTDITEKTHILTKDSENINFATSLPISIPQKTGENFEELKTGVGKGVKICIPGNSPQVNFILPENNPFFSSSPSTFVPSSSPSYVNDKSSFDGFSKDIPLNDKSSIFPGEINISFSESKTSDSNSSGEEKWYESCTASKKGNYYCEEKCSG